MNNKLIKLLVASATVATLMTASTAFAAAPTLFGGATLVTNAARLVSNTADTQTANDYSGINFSVANGTTLASLTNLSATYNITNGQCGGGSPRYSIGVANGTTTGNVFAYFGPQPNYTNCVTNQATSTGNLLTSGISVDTSQLPGGTFYDTDAHLLSAYGNYTVTGVALVVDGGASVSGNIQTVRITNATVGANNYVFASTTLMAPVITSPANNVTLTSAAFGKVIWSTVTSPAGEVAYIFESSLSSSANADGSFVTPAYQAADATTSIQTANTLPGTYYYHVVALDSAGNISPWSATNMVTISNTVITPPTPLQNLIAALTQLLSSFPGYSTQIQALITQLNMGTSTATTTPPVVVPPTNTGQIDNNNQTVRVGGSIDFVGRNFGHEESVVITMGGNTVATAHADGGGNFSTGSMAVPSTPGTYVYTFTGQTSGITATATLVVTS